jgi:hypothetical protein
MKAGSAFIAVGLVILSMMTVSARAEQAPVFSFKPGETLKYTVKFHSQSAPGAAQSSTSDLTGEAAFQPLKPDATGAATIKITTSGSGKIIMNGQYLDLGGSTKPVQFLLAVKPDGTITKVMNAQGAKTTFMDKAVLFNPGFSMLPFIAMSYDLFGLQLPSKLPAPKGTWTGYQMLEGGTFTNAGKMQVTLKRQSVTYTFLGRQQALGHNCLVFSYPFKMTGPSGSGSLPCMIYFDDALGQVIGLQLKGSTSQGSVDMSISLAE